MQVLGQVQDRLDGDLGFRVGAPLADLGGGDRAGCLVESGEAAGAEAVGAVRVRSPAARSGDVAQAAMAAGADRLHGPRFEYDDERATRGELLGEAVDDARRKAERLASAAGRRLGAVHAIEETSPDLVPMAEPVALRVAGAPDITPRDLTVTATVKVVFALEG